MQLLRRCAHVYRSVQVEPILGMELFRRCTDVFRYKTPREIADNCCSRVVVCMTPLLLGCHPHLAPIVALVSARCAAAAAAVAAAAAAANGVYPSTTEIL